MNPTVTDNPSFQDSSGDQATGQESGPGGEAPSGTAETRRKKSPEATAASARNAVGDGFRSVKYYPVDLEAMIKRALAALLKTHQPTTDRQTMLVVELARAEGQLEKAAAMEIADMLRIQYQAETSWDKDRREVIDALGSRLAAEPDRIKRALERSKQGTDWLLEKWERLLRIVAAAGFATDLQRSLMFDLLGVEQALRTGTTEVPAAVNGPALLAICQQEIARLRELLEDGLRQRDERWRQMAACGMPYDADARTKQHWSYAAAARRMRDRALRELLRLQGQGAAPAPEEPPPRKTRPRAKPKTEPDPRGPAMSNAELARLSKMSMETGLNIDVLLWNPQATAADAGPVSAGAEVVAPAETVAAAADQPQPAAAAAAPRCITPAAAATARRREEEYQQKARKEEDRHRKRAGQNKSRKGNQRRGR